MNPAKRTRGVSLDFLDGCFDCVGVEHEI
ncbi:hypothetical protein MNBD_NITROSPINAE05-929, partial [hydrothermal vent metagenome]